MDPLQTLMTTITTTVHFIVGTVRRADASARLGDDTGAVSIEQVLWYAAAAVSVAVVAAIVWSQIRTTASTPVQSPSAP